MAIFSRYRNSPVLGLGAQYGTSRAIAAIREGIRTGIIPTVEVTTVSGNQRLDQLAALYYNDARFWWVLSAASDIGWALQVPEGTLIIVPDINAVAGVVG
jgi:hypothetical protein